MIRFVFVFGLLIMTTSAQAAVFSCRALRVHPSQQNHVLGDFTIDTSRASSGKSFVLNQAGDTLTCGTWMEPGYALMCGVFEKDSDTARGSMVVADSNSRFFHFTAPALNGPKMFAYIVDCQRRSIR